MRTILLSVLFLLSGCAANPLVFEVGVYYDAHTQKDVGRLALRQYVGKKNALRDAAVFVEAAHESNPSKGWPFNDEAELNEFDGVGVGVAVPLWKAQ